MKDNKEVNNFFYKNFNYNIINNNILEFIPESLYYFVMTEQMNYKNSINNRIDSFQFNGILYKKMVNQYPTEIKKLKQDIENGNSK